MRLLVGGLDKKTNNNTINVGDFSVRNKVYFLYLCLSYFFMTHPFLMKLNCTCINRH